MKSIKPGRGPSKMNAVGSIFAAIFGVFWCIVAGTTGAGFMIPFGLLFIGLSIYQAIYHSHNATSENRFSEFDIVDDAEELDPLNEKYSQSASQIDNLENDRHCNTNTAYCPYCGRPIKSNFKFCPECGQKLST